MAPDTDTRKVELSKYELKCPKQIGFSLDETGECISFGMCTGFGVGAAMHFVFGHYVMCGVFLASAAYFGREMYNYRKNIALSKKKTGELEKELVE